MIRYCFLILSLAITQVPALAQINQRIDAILSQQSCENAQFSISFCDAATGQSLYSHRADRPLAPASNMKIITTAAALEQLGLDFTYDTTFGLIGDNLAIFGAGDPLLGDPVIAENNGKSIDAVFELLLTALHERGITSITGNLLIDDTIFDDQRFHPSWPVEQSNSWYTAQVSAICYNDNCLDVTLTPNSQAGRPASFQLSPPTEYAQITNRTETVSSGRDTAWASRQIGGNDIVLRGNVRHEQTIFVTVDRPSAFFGYALAEYLLRHNINIDGRLIIRRLRQDNGQLPTDLDVLTVHSTPLIDVVRRCNQQSLNLAAECLCKTLGAYYQLPQDTVVGQGSWQSGRAAVRQFLRQLNIDQESLVIDDGSGLSRQNRISAQVITKVLVHRYQDPITADVFRESLATPNTDGTLQRRRRFSDPDLRDRIYAKTGYISGAWALSGYCQDQNGRWLAFSVIANRSGGASLRPVIDEIVTAVMQQ
ncbi:MAG: D-alanyl-D-alanine carboxypeptidase/D-alanyl-D-alanine-endopeptidase [Sedimentisphaerales bacterium]|nr:D-alanyl-D-alanine carboxypeptidase/D-alanyl-D-alanine-endopeptidase [Sedimentisphaerales bacterium]